jgi:cytochrome c peroxidase
MLLLFALALLGCNRQTTPPVSQEELVADEYWRGRIVLGSPSLTAGIPGSGELTLTDIQRWLDNSKNHEILDFVLPLGLRSDEGHALAKSAALTRAKIELGRQLFCDRRLSRCGVLACIDCHHPQRQFTSDELGHARLRETAVVFNRILSEEQFWDGRAKTLDDQIHFPLENEDEFGTTPDECVERIRQIEGYRLQFDAIFGKLDYEGLCEAIAAFERALVSEPSAWDFDVEFRRLEAMEEAQRASEDSVWLLEIRKKASEQPMSKAASRGAELFFSDRVGCARCHQGPNFTDEQYYDVGLRPRSGENSPLRSKQAADLGRFHVTGEDQDRYRFKTPTLRNVALTWPYMHDGRFTRLEQVVAHFAKGGDTPYCDVQPFELNTQEAADLVAFLESLTGPLPQPPTDRLPP